MALRMRKFVYLPEQSYDFANLPKYFQHNLINLSIIGGAFSIIYENYWFELTIWLTVRVRWVFFFLNLYAWRWRGWARFLNTFLGTPNHQNWGSYLNMRREYQRNMRHLPMVQLIFLLQYCRIFIWLISFTNTFR